MTMIKNMVSVSQRIIVCVLLLSMSLFSVRALAQAQADYWMLTDLATSAEVAASGGVEGFSYSANNVFENPAGLYRVNSASIAMFATTVMEEVNYFNASLAAKTSFGTFAVGFMQATIEDIPNTGQRDDLNNTFFARYLFDYRNTLLKATYQNQFSENVYYGVSAVRYEHFFDNVEGIGYNMDVGLLGDWDWYEVSFSLRNIFDSSDMDYGDDGKENLPLQATLGSVFRLDDIAIHSQAKTQSGHTMLSGGVSYRPSMLNFFKLSGGYRQFLVLDDVESTYSFGLGLILNGVGFHYAYEKSDHFEFDNKNYFSLNIDF